MVSETFCWLMKINPVNRPESKPVSILSVKYLREVFSGFCNIQIGIRRECCFPLNNSQFGCVLLFP